MKYFIALLFIFDMAQAETRLPLISSGEESGAKTLISYPGPSPEGMPERVQLSPGFVKLMQDYGTTIATMQQELLHSHLSQELFRLNRYEGGRDSGFVFYGVDSVEELKDFCALSDLGEYNVPAEGKVVIVSCSVGREIFLVRPYFLRMNQRHQFLVLLHELLNQMTDKQGGRDLGIVAGFVSGANTVIEVLARQYRGERKELSPKELRLVTDFFKNGLHLASYTENVDLSSYQFKIHPFGGGLLLQSSEVSQDSFVSVGSVLKGKIRVLENAQILASSLVGQFVVEEKVLIQSSEIRIYQDGRLGKGSRFLTSKVDLKDFSIGFDAKIESSTIDSYHKIQIGHHFRMERSSIDFRRDSEVREIKDGQSLVDGKVSDELIIKYAPLGAVVHPVNFKGKIKTKCYEATKESPPSGNDCYQMYSKKESLKTEKSLRIFNYEDERVEFSFKPLYRSWSQKRFDIRFYYSFVTEVISSVTIKPSSVKAPEGNFVIFEGKIYKAGTEILTKFDLEIGYNHVFYHSYSLLIQGIKAADPKAGEFTSKDYGRLEHRAHFTL